jgi:hypothetical protein
LSHLADPLVAPLLLTPLWLLAPWVDGRLGHIVDRFFLRRRYSPVEAERLFTSELQAASSEDDLRSRTERVLTTIFQARTEVGFAPTSPTAEQDPRAMFSELGQSGWAAIEPRVSGIPCRCIPARRTSQVWRASRNRSDR